MEYRKEYEITTETYDVPFPNNYAVPFHIFERGEGCYLFDKNDKKFLDFGSGIAVNALGYGREDLASVAFKQMKKLIHVSNLYTTEPSLELGFKLISSGNFDAVHFGNSGSEANEAAIKYARLYSKRIKGDGKYKILAFTNAFHGRTLGALSCTPTEKYQEPFGPLLPGVEFSDFNDVEALEKVLSPDFAAVIVEPVQGEGGLDVMTEEFATRLNSLCRELDIILIADEIQTGIARTGFPYASAVVGLEPDIITLSKPLAGGLPLSATLIPKKINKLVKAGEHGTTFGGGPVTCAVANKVLDIIFTPSFLADVQSKGDYLAKGLEKLSEKHAAAGKVKGLGLLRGIEIGKPDEEGMKLCGEIIKKAMDNGLLLLRSGKNILRIAPPLVITESEIDKGLEIISNILEEV
ncbi:MAG: acetylornithine/succinylornithine family transaminase [Spirochaetales bacterium]|nr:acetylornithine/succinylornithine family transaminase [Spirochaetales bacterium]